MIVKLLNEHHLEFLSLKGDCRGSSESTYVKIPHCWKSHALAHLLLPSEQYSSGTGRVNIVLVIFIYFSFHPLSSLTSVGMTSPPNSQL